MSRIAIDLSKCQGYANCLVEAPEHFDLGPDNRAVVTSVEVSEAGHRAVVEAVRSCPTGALRLEP